MPKMSIAPKKKGFGKMDMYTPDGPMGGKQSERRVPNMSDGDLPDAARNHTGGTAHFQAEHGREWMPGAPGGSRSMEGE